jgi:hypothetical protein
MWRLILGFIGSGLLLLAPGPLGVLVGEGSRLAGVTLLWLFLAGLPGGRPVPAALVLACALPCLVAAGRLDPGFTLGVETLHLLLGVLLIGLLAHGSWGAQNHSQPGRARRYEMAWWLCLILPQALALCWTFGGLQDAPLWLQSWVRLGPFDSFLRAELPMGLGSAPVLTLVPWLLVVWPTGDKG